MVDQIPGQAQQFNPPIPQQPGTSGITPPLNPVIQQPNVPPLPKKNFPVKNLVLIIIGVAVLVLIVVVATLIFRNVRKAGSREVVWWGLWEDEQTIKPLIDEYQSKNPDVKIKYIKQSPQDYRERLMNSLAKSEGPDIFRFHNSWVPMFKNELDQMPPSVMDASTFTQTFYPVASSDLISGAGIVGIPLEYDALTLYINEDIFAQAGKQPPTTWDDLRVLARELTKKDDQGAITQAGVALGRTENVDHWPEILALMMLQNGVDLSNPTGQLAEDALKFYTLFSTVDGVWDAALPPSTVAFANGRVAMYFGPSWRYFEIKQQNQNLKFKAVNLPQLPKQNPSEPDVAYATYWSEGVWARSENKESAWNFLKFLSTKESLAKLYENAAKIRDFGEPYPRPDMAELLISHPILGSIIQKAPDAQSWYLQSRTFDGPTGINSQINKYFQDAVNSVNSGGDPGRALSTVVQGVSQVLSQYGLTSH